MSSQDAIACEQAIPSAGPPLMTMALPPTATQDEKRDHAARGGKRRASEKVENVIRQRYACKFSIELMLGSVEGADLRNLQ